MDKEVIYVTILVLVDSVLQLNLLIPLNKVNMSHNPCFSGQCFAIRRNNYGITRNVKSQSLF